MAAIAHPASKMLPSTRMQVSCFALWSTGLALRPQRGFSGAGFRSPHRASHLSAITQARAASS